ncbi:MAG: TRAFs-binding domain-containing protein [Thiotrichales bacterium]
MSALCFVLIPPGRKIVAGVTVDYDGLYAQVIHPAITAAGLKPLRADTDFTSEADFTLLSERLILCEFALVDASSASPAALFALGLRDGLEPTTTVLLTAEQIPNPLATTALPTVAYALAPDGGLADAAAAHDRLSAWLTQAQRSPTEPVTLNPIFQLVEPRHPRPIDRLKTDIFRARAAYDPEVRARLDAARGAGKTAVHAVARALGTPNHLEAGVLVDLLLSLRAVSDWGGMLELAAAMPAPLARSRMVREQCGFALNRLGQRDAAEAMLTAVIADYGPSSETNSLLGRLYKDRWEQALRLNEHVTAEHWLNRAIDAYRQGFEADWRDAFPGVNTVTLMELQTPPDPRQAELLPVVTYAVQRRIAAGAPDYWDHATLIELAVLRRDPAAAQTATTTALAAVRERWEPESTARNLSLIRAARQKRGEAVAWIKAIEHRLLEGASAE